MAPIVQKLNGAAKWIIWILTLVFLAGGLVATLQYNCKTLSVHEQKIGRNTDDIRAIDKTLTKLTTGQENMAADLQIVKKVLLENRDR